MTDTTYGFKIFDTTKSDKDGSDAPVHHSGDGYASRDEAWQAMMTAFRNDDGFPTDNAFLKALEGAGRRNPMTPTSIGYWHEGSSHRLAVLLTESAKSADAAAGEASDAKAQAGTYGFRIADTSTKESTDPAAPLWYRETGYPSKDEAWEAMVGALKSDPKFAGNAAVKKALDSSKRRNPMTPTRIDYQDGDQFKELTVEVVED
ncbi:hypothetical protein B841_11305 [Corynebacterium maris DSM 45190]|uniref:Uncharacterized protein n=1 Tax=Corynebacterium maris DSM 45190 TaxID=1224163 RepID=S5TM06_9CORY|nr:hypothetical protein [Corynebacterium maris]AGS35733.1 hypothetical protein B841_11305 [Corynebacterium maris DSM 45190]